MVNTHTQKERRNEITFSKELIELKYIFHFSFLQELNVFQDSLQTLKIAKSKFAGSKDALEQISEDWKEKEILVPLTGSMYVPGIINHIDKFVIDVGTGYYVEKVSTADDYS